MNSLLYPDAEQLTHLMNELCAFFAQMPAVVQVIAFGSLVRKDSDRWSDLDLIVVTSHQSQFQQVFAQLTKFKPILHHTPFTRHVDSEAAYILGIVFVNESVFHCLDLNFLSLAQAQSPNALERFGVLQTLYSRDDLSIANENEIFPALPEDDPVEKRINEAMHFIKKALKKVLRQKATRDDLRSFADNLKHVLRDYQPDIVVPGGNIGQLAHTFLDMAEGLLVNQ